MKFAVLFWAGLTRRKGRTFLIFLQVAVAFALFGVLQGLKTGVEEAVARSRADVLVVHSKGTFGPLPLAYLETIRTIPGIKLARGTAHFLATYQKPTQAIGVVAATEINKAWFDALPDLATIAAPSQLAVFQQTKTGALITDDLATKYGWKIGDHIPLNSMTEQLNGSTDWTFDVVGIFRDTDVVASEGSRNFIIVHYSYVDDARLKNKGTAEDFFVVASDPRQAAAVADAIDRRFANSSNETQTDSLHDFAQQQMQQIGDLNFAIRSIVTAVLVTLLFSTATMMMQSVRERTPELAVLKTIGFTDAATFGIVLAEAFAVYVLGAMAGLALALLAFPWAAKLVPGISMPLIVVAIGVGLSLVAAALSVALPAARAARLQVADALAGR
jgi:putative ABC transport system permease protein